MSRIVLIHWNEAEAAERAQRLQRAGRRVEHLSGDGAVVLRTLRANPPDAVVIDLERLPSHGRAMGVALRQLKVTRSLPIVFVGGEEDKIERVRKELPDAAFAPWNKIGGALRRALERPPSSPVVPGTMGAYSGTPLPRKLGVRSGRTVGLLGAPEGFERKLEPLPEDCPIRRQARGQADLIVLFVDSQAALARRLPGAMRMMRDKAALWIAWPKKASGVASDLSEQHVRRTGLDAGLVDYKICSIDETWSGLRFARRAND